MIGFWFEEVPGCLRGFLTVRSGSICVNVYGASLGLPIVKDKLFFSFGAYEGAKIAESSTQTRVVPTASLAAGNLKYTNSGQVRPPPSHVLSQPRHQWIQTVLRNGTCPLGPGVNSAALAYFKQYPLPNSTASGDGLDTSAYTFSSPNPVSNTTLILKLDYAISSKHLLFVRGNLQDDNSSTAIQFPVLFPRPSCVIRQQQGAEPRGNRLHMDNLADDTGQ